MGRAPKELLDRLNWTDFGPLDNAEVARMMRREGFECTDPDHGPQFVRRLSDTRFLVLQGDGARASERSDFTLHEIEISGFSESERDRFARSYYGSWKELLQETEDEREANRLLAEMIAEQTDYAFG